MLAGRMMHQARMINSKSAPIYVRYDRPWPAPALSVDDCLYRLGLDNWMVNDDIWAWPPDVFAVAALLLRESGGYVDWLQTPAHLIGAKPLTNPLPPRLRAIRKQSSRIANAWRQSALRKAPPEVMEIIKQLRLHKDRAVRADLPDDLSFWLVALMCIADEASGGFGLPPTPAAGRSGARRKIRSRGAYQVARSAAFKLVLDSVEAFEKSEELAQHHLGFTLGSQIHPSRGRILPKMRTPQRGASLRSFTHHLAFLPGTDVRPHWIATQYKHGARQLHQPYIVAALPLPYETAPAQFRHVRVDPQLKARLPEGHDFFTIQPAPLPRHFRTRLNDLLDSIATAVGNVSGLLLPEMALSRDQFDEVFGDGIPGNLDFLVCGVYEPATSERLGRNYAVIRLRNQHGFVERIQHKHHRWALDAAQIRTYGVGAMLDPRKVWWEAIELPRRDLHFFHLDNHTVFSVLICEDLARPDPVGDCLRAVGPNFLVGLLSDGPQIPQRWSARCATVLADDPGSSVLTLSSLGMVNLSRPEGRITEHSRAVALWREPVGNAVPTRELVINLEQGMDAVVLSLVQQPEREFSMDGRDDDENAGTLRLGGVYQTRMPT